MFHLFFLIFGDFSHDTCFVSISFICDFFNVQTALLEQLESFKETDAALLGAAESCAVSVADAVLSAGKLFLIIIFEIKIKNVF